MLKNLLFLMLILILSVQLFGINVTLSKFVVEDTSLYANEKESVLTNYLKKGDKVLVIKEINDMSFIKTSNNISGYVKTKYLSFNKPITETIKKIKTKKELKIYSSPKSKDYVDTTEIGDSFEVLSILYENDKMFLETKEGFFLLIEDPNGSFEDIDQQQDSKKEVEYSE